MNVKMNKILFALIVIAITSCQATNHQAQNLTLKGQIKNQVNGTKVYLEELTYTSRNAIDTAVLDEKGNFSISATPKNNGLYQLRIGDQHAIFLVLDEKPAKVEVKGDTSDITKFTYKISGSPASEQLRDFIVHTKSYGEQFSKALSEYQLNVTETTPDSVRKIYEAKMMGADSAFRIYATNYADTAKNPVLAIFAATNLDYQRDQPAFEKLADRLKKDHAELPFVQAYLQMLDTQKMQAQQSAAGPKFSTGMQAPDIALTDINGESVKLSSLHGKYVLLDFWASWCGPCRRENPTVVQAYETYKDKGFTVYSVSLDTDKEKWIQGIKKDKLMWPYHVSDLRGWQSSVCELYGIRSIPQNFLLDKDGKIIASGLRGDALLNTLQSVLQ
jgi:peroxiredoxin